MFLACFKICSYVYENHAWSGWNKVSVIFCGSIRPSSHVGQIYDDSTIITARVCADTYTHACLVNA